ncbi:MAG: osmoprotectant transport system permease protein [Solirubrobacteraceae bacterium]|jgi:osmoprotectant transport system permease protein|nr:osmoprotectant transport system permease protein [Solirubrobacteraceae bacterium]
MIIADTVIPDFGGGAGSCVRENKGICWNWVSDNWGGVLWPAVKQHVVLTAIAVVIGFALAFALALLAHRHRKLESPITVTTGVLYTIPSLALFQILVGFSFLGLNRLTVEIALVSYTLLILFRNTLTGLRDVPEDVREAAEGMGLTPRQILTKVELPLALPAIIAGLRIATVTVISLATVAAFIDDEGLGSPIFRAIQSNVFKTELFAAGFLAVALALLADATLVLAQRAVTPWARRQRA